MCAGLERALVLAMMVAGVASCERTDTPAQTRNPPMQTPTPKELSPEHAVIVHFTYGSTDLKALFDLEDRLESAINDAGVGEYDGNEIAVDGSDGSLYMYGPNADRLFETVRPILETTPFMFGAKVKRRYGRAEDGVRETIDVVAPNKGIEPTGSAGG